MGNRFLELATLGKNGALRWLGGTLLVIICWFIIGGILSIPFLMIGGLGRSTNLSETDPFWTYLGTNVTFFGIWLGLYLVIRFVHRRAFRTLVTPEPALSWTRLAQGFAVFIVLVALVQIAEFVVYPARLQWSFDPARWLVFLPFVLVLTPLQTTAEELLFRGYWLQGTGRLTQNVAILAVVNGILFALPHMLNPEVLNNPNDTLLLFANYFVTGVAFAVFTLRDQRLELALGAHAANNLFAALLVNYASSALTTPALITNPVLDAYFGLGSILVISVAFYFILFGWLDRRAVRAA